MAVVKASSSDVSLLARLMRTEAEGERPLGELLSKTQELNESGKLY